MTREMEVLTSVDHHFTESREQECWMTKTADLIDGAKETGFLIYPRRRHSVRDAWWNECRELRIAFIVVRQRKRLADVEWFAHTMADDRWSLCLTDSAAVVCEAHIEEALLRSRCGEATYFGFGVSGVVRGITLHEARRLAEWLAWLLSDAESFESALNPQVMDEDDREPALEHGDVVEFRYFDFPEPVHDCS